MLILEEYLGDNAVHKMKWFGTRKKAEEAVIKLLLDKTGPIISWSIDGTLWMITNDDKRKQAQTGESDLKKDHKLKQWVQKRKG